MDSLTRQMQLPLAIFGVLMAGTVAFLPSHFQQLKAEHNLKDLIFIWVDFTTNVSLLCGLIPGILLKLFGPKRSIFIGGVALAFAQINMARFVPGEVDTVTHNKSPIYTLTLCAVAGQGACLIFLATLQAILQTNTIVSGHVTCTVLLVYFFGADSLTLIATENQISDWKFSTVMAVLAAKTVLIQIVNVFVLQETEEGDELIEEEDTLQKGILFKRIGYLYQAIVVAYVALTLVVAIQGYKMEELAIATNIMVTLNIVVPLIFTYLIGQETFEGMMMNSSATDQWLVTRGVDFEVREVLSRSEFWLYSLITFIIVGNARMIEENSTTFALNVPEDALRLQRAYQSFELVGIAFSGLLLTFFRDYVSPVGLIIFSTVVMALSQAIMLHPDLNTGVSLLYSTIGAANAFGIYILAIASYCNEEYGAMEFGQIFSLQLSAGALGLVAYDELMITVMVEVFGEHHKGQGGEDQFYEYGEWTAIIFFVTTCAACFAVFLSVLAHYLTKDSNRQTCMETEMIKF